jgi:hypothetical protein
MKSASFLSRWFCVVVLSTLCCRAGAQVSTLMATATATGTPAYSAADVVLAAGDYAIVTSQINQLNSNGSCAVVEISGKEFSIPNNLVITAAPGSGGSSSIVPTNGWMFSGPARIRAKVITNDAGNIGQSGIVTVNAIRANAVPTISPHNAAVIPADAAGNFSVLLESSTDMVTWTPATAGNYSSTTQKRFFRVRILKL